MLCVIFIESHKHPRCVAMVVLPVCVLLSIAYQVQCEKYNVLLILVDDLRPLTDKNVKLPNIRKMAAAGVNFKNAFAQQSLCAPSRNSMLTGRRPDTLRLYDFYSYWRRSVGNFTTLPQFFKQHGYDTFSAGKVFHPGQSSNHNDDYPYSWSYHPYHPPTNNYKDAAVCEDEITNKLQKDLVCPVNVMKQPGKSLPDLQTVDYAIKILKNRKMNPKPFFLAVGFHKPHIPLKYPEEYLDRVPIKNVEMPSFPQVPTQMPLVAWHPWTDLRQRDDIKRLDIPFPLGIMPPDWTLKIRQSYYAAAAYVDDLIGKLMKHVTKEKTIVVFTSDHGWSLGENGLWAKYSNFDVALRVPLIFIVPKIPRRSVNKPVELVDVFPTLLELAGYAKHIKKCQRRDKSRLCFEGDSLVPLMTNNLSKNGQTFRKSFAISQYPRPNAHPQIDTDKPRLKDITIMGYSIRTNRYRYTEWISFNNIHFTRNWNKVYGKELYDHDIDPEESNNVYLKSEYQHMRKKLSHLLRSEVDPITLIFQPLT